MEDDVKRLAYVGAALLPYYMGMVNANLRAWWAVLLLSVGAGVIAGIVGARAAEAR